MQDKKILSGGAAFFIAALTAFLIPTVILTIISATGNTAAFTAANYTLSFVTQISFAVIVIICNRLTKSKPDFRLIRSGAASYIGGVTVTLIGLVSFYLITALCSFGLTAVGYPLSSSGLDSTAAWIISGIRVVIFAPICEELLMRSSVLTGLNSMNSRKKLANLKSVILCGLLFMILHMNPEQNIYQFLFGCVLAMLTIASGSIIPAIIAHATNNIAALLLEAPFAAGLGRWIISFFQNLPALFVITAVLLAAGGLIAIYFICKYIRTKSTATAPVIQSAETDKYTRNSGKIFYIMGAAICIIVWTIQLIAGITGGAA